MKIISIKMAYLMLALRYFDVSGFLEVVWSHLGDFYVLAVCFPLKKKAKVSESAIHAKRGYFGFM